MTVPELDDDDTDDRPFVKDGSVNSGVDDGLLEGGGGGGVNVFVPNGGNGRRPSFSVPGINGPGFVTINGVQTPIPDVNAYQHKKTLAQGMMDLALLSANANQLRYVLETNKNHPYFYPSLLFISTSIIFQVNIKSLRERFLIAEIPRPGLFSCSVFNKFYFGIYKFIN